MFNFSRSQEICNTILRTHSSS